MLCKEQIKELDDRLNGKLRKEEHLNENSGWLYMCDPVGMFPCVEFRKEIHLLVKEEETKQGSCMEGLLESLQDLHTVVSKMISKNKGKL